MKEKIKVGIVGLGQRGYGLLTTILTIIAQDDIEIAALCDLYEDRIEAGVSYVKDNLGNVPFSSTDYMDLVNMKELDAILIIAAWDAHIPIALAAMKSGKYVGTEVGGAYSIHDCWDLVNTSEQTGMPCMMLENCCYGRREMMALNMAEQGVLGDIVYCSGGYCHDLREEVSGGIENRHYRFRNYLRRNCENYPTHELGPIAKILKINHGNQFLTLNSVSSCSKGLHEFIVQKRGADSDLAKLQFAQGDVITTTIKCAGGQTIVMTLDTTLPRGYSRGFTVRGTRGMYMEDNDSVFIDGMHNEFDLDWKPQWGNASQFEEKYDHPMWVEYKNHVVGGHDGMDWLVFRDFFDSVKAGTQTPIDVYDTAAWMSISALSENSIAMSGAPVAIPDFTRGEWLK